MEDLLQIGMVGLIEAAHNYAPQEGVTFENYAELRLKAQSSTFCENPQTCAEEQ